MTSLPDIHTELKSLNNRFDRIESILNESSKPHLDLKEAAKYISVPVSTIRHYIRTKVIDSYRCQKRVYLSKESLDNFILNKKNHRRSKAQIEAAAHSYLKTSN